MKYLSPSFTLPAASSKVSQEKWDEIFNQESQMHDMPTDFADPLCNPYSQVEGATAPEEQRAHSGKPRKQSRFSASPIRSKRSRA